MSFCVAGVALCDTFQPVLYHLESSFMWLAHQCTPHFTLYTLQSTLYTPHSTLHTPPHSTLYTWHTPHPSLHALHSTIYTLDSLLHTLHSTLHTLHFTLHTLHFTLLTPYTPHSTHVSPWVVVSASPGVGWCVRLPEGLVSPCVLLSPLVSPCLRVSPFLFPFLFTASCFPLLDGVSTFPRGQVGSPCLALSPSLVAKPYTVRGSWCLMVCPPSPRSCLLLSPIVPLVVSFCWLVCPPSRQLVSTCLPLYPFFLVSLHLPLPIVPLLVSLCWMVHLPFGGSCLPWYPSVPDLVSLCWMVCVCVRLIEGVVSDCLPLCPFLFSLVGWRVHLPEGLVSLCLTLPIVPLFVSFCWMSCPPFRGFVSPCPRLYPFLFPFVPFVGWSVRLSEGLVSLCLPLPIVPSCFPLLDGALSEGLVSPCTPFSPSCCPLLDGVSGLPLIVSDCFPLLDGVSGLVFVGWCVHVSEDLVSPCLRWRPFLFPFVGSRVRLSEGLVSACIPMYPFLLPFVGWCVRSSFNCLPLFPLVG